MTVTITENRTLVDEADSTTGWTGTAALTTPTSDPNPVESTASLGMAVSTATDYVYHTITSVDLTSTLIYVWILANGTMDTLTNGGIQIILGNGTDRVGYHLAGSDVAAFRHSDGPVGWQCLLLDTSVLPTAKTVHTGAEVNLAITAITEIGAVYKTLSKALGGSANCFTDVIRYGNGGLILTAGTSGAPATFDNIATVDRSTATTTAYGICRELGAGVFGIQGPLIFGDSVGTSAHWFEIQNQTIVFEDRGIGTTKYSFDIVSNSTGNTTWKSGTKVGTDGGSDGCSFIVPSGVGASWDSTDVDVEVVDLYASTFAGWDGGMLFSIDATNAPNHEIFTNTFSLCGQISPGLTDFRNNTISASTDATGSILLPSATTNFVGNSFISDGTGHAILISTAGTYSLTDLTYSGFAASDGSTGNECIYNNSGGNVILNISGGDTPTIRNGTSATTTVNTAQVTLTLTVKDIDTGNIIVGARVIVTVADSTNYSYQDSVTITSSTTIATVTHTAHGLVTGDDVFIEGAVQGSYNGAFSITVTDVNTYTYTMDASAISPATGTITSTLALINEITNVSGQVTDTRSYSVNQLIEGRVRNSSSSPFYKTSPLTGTIDKDNGLTITAQMISDE